MTGKLNQKNQTFDEFVTREYLPYARTRKRSWQMDERISRKYISPNFGHRKINEITMAEIEDWQNRLLANGFSAASVNRFFSTFKTIFIHAENHDLIAFGHSPARRLRLLKTPPVRERYLTPKEGRALLERLSVSNDRRARAIELILLTGARKNEILKAKWEYIDFERHTLEVPISKSGKTRLIALSRSAMKIIEKLSRNDSIWVFPGKNPEKPLNDVYSFWNIIRKEIGLKDTRIHDLRHTFASWLVNKGHSLYEIQKLLGHSDPRTTMRYAHLELNALLNATESISVLLEMN